MKQHQLKLESFFFEAVLNGRKTFELRYDDRNYQVGDLLVLMEYDGDQLTGREVKVQVTYKLESYTGLAQGYCILGICRI